MTIPQELFVRRVLAKREPLIMGALLGGWSDYLKSPEANRWRRKSFRAALVWERTIDRLVDNFIDDPGLHFVEHHDTISFVVDDAVLFRIKKGNIRKLSCNYPTQMALAFHNHQQDLFGYSGLQRVEVVYVLNQHETNLESVCVVARDGDNVVWWYELAVDGSAVVPMPLEPLAPKPAGGIVRLKKQDDDEKRESD